MLLQLVSRVAHRVSQRRLATEGAAADPRLYPFASDVDADQRIELDRMARIAETVTPPSQPLRESGSARPRAPARPP